MKRNYSVLPCLNTRALVVMFALISVFALALTTHADDDASHASDAGSASDTDKAPLWVTSVDQIGVSGQFVAATASGLLLRESTVMSFSGSDPTELSPLYTHPAAAWCVDSSSDGKTIASVDYRGNLVIYDVDTKQAATHEKVFERWCQALIISADDKTVIAGNEAGKLMTWNLESGKIAESVDLDEHAITGLAISPDAKQLAVSDGAGHVHLLKWPGLKEIGKIQISEETVWCVAYSTDGSQLFAGSSDRNLYRCDAKADAKPKSIVKGKDWITRIAVSPSGQVAASEVGGRLHFPSLGGSDSMVSASGVWALCWNGDEQLIAGTRKHGLVTAGRTWKWTEAKQAEPEPAPKAEPKDEKVAEETTLETETEKPADTDDADTEADDTEADDTEADDTETDDTGTDQK